MSNVELTNLLTSVFEVDQKRAEEVARSLTVETFDSNFSRLEAIIGFDNAAFVVKEGRFLGYRNNEIENYFKLAHDVSAKIDHSLPIPVQIFYSIESLHEFLRSKQEGKVAIDVSRLNISKYRLLHPDNEQSKKYLNTLIEDGHITVETNERWNKSLNKGVRAVDIVRKIAYELTMVFNDLDIGRPWYNLNNGQMKLIITHPTTREYLKEIRDKVYALKK